MAIVTERSCTRCGTALANSARFCPRCGQNQEGASRRRLLIRVSDIFSIERLERLLISLGVVAPVVLARQIWLDYVRTDKQPAGFLVWSGFVVALVGAPWVLLWLLNVCADGGRVKLAQAIASLVWLSIVAFGITFLTFVAWLFYVAS